MFPIDFQAIRCIPSLIESAGGEIKRKMYEIPICCPVLHAERRAVVELISSGWRLELKNIDARLPLWTERFTRILLQFKDF